MSNLPIDPPAIVRPAEGARAWMTARWRSIEAREGQNLKAAREIGEFLAAQKPAVGHGNWIKWLKDNAPFDRRRAWEFMSIHEHWESVSGAGSIREAVRVIEENGKCPARGHLEEDDESSTTSRPAQTSAPKPPPPPPPPPPVREPSPPVKPKPSWSAPAASRNGPSRPAAGERQEQAAFEEKHVKPLVDTSWITPDVGHRLRGEELVAFVRGAVRKAEGLMSDVQSLRVHLDESPAVVQASFVCLELHTKLESALSQALLEVARA